MREINQPAVRSEDADKPLFLKSVVEPLDDRVEMGKLSKMCKNSFYGN
ncbi:hypothetical protein [Williamsia sp. DF01-3]|nr:hypothetical protein [Williamsia sp. DF01-3]MCK0515699.1 hypothetical protein [Williamsia sp. DF01-3]